MYTPKHFTEGDPARIAAIIEQYSFATLLSATPEGIQITHAPLVLDAGRGPHGTLVGHIARANPHAGALQDGGLATAIFHGPHGYVSPTWYLDQNPRIPNVPTWNYMALHIHGRVRRIDEPAAKLAIVTDLSSRFETPGDAAWKPGDTTAHAAQLAAIVGFEITIEHIEAKAKLSQNRSANDRRRVIDALVAGAHPDGKAMAAWMEADLERSAGN
jgi:transcriptional regulator